MPLSTNTSHLPSKRIRPPARRATACPSATVGSPVVAPYALAYLLCRARQLCLHLGAPRTAKPGAKNQGQGQNCGAAVQRRPALRSTQPTAMAAGQWAEGGRWWRSACRPEACAGRGHPSLACGVQRSQPRSHAPTARKMKGKKMARMPICRAAGGGGGGGGSHTHDMMAHAPTCCGRAAPTPPTH